MTMTYAASADTQVKSTSPTKNYGTLDTLRLRAGTAEQPETYRSLVRFVVPPMGSVTSAKLRLFVTDASKSGGSVFATASSWTETGTTWNNAPGPVGSALATAGASPAGQWVEYNVTSAVQAGTFNFVLTTTSSDSLIVSSREGAQDPQLVITHT
jgi:hypothetical protein